MKRKWSRALVGAMAEELYSSGGAMKDVLLLPARKFPDRTSFIYHDECGRLKKIDYADYERLSLLTGKHLSNLLASIPRDSFVGLKMKNSPKWCFHFWGLIAAGYRVLFINSLLTEEDTKALLLEAGAKAIVTDDGKAYGVPTIAPVSLNSEEELTGFTPRWADGIAFATSGTTGQSRIYVYTGRECANLIEAGIDMINKLSGVVIPENARILVNVPFAHIYGFTTCVIWYAFFAAALVFPKSLSPVDIGNCCRQEKITEIYSVPLFWDSVVKSFWKRLKGTKFEGPARHLISFTAGELTAEEAGKGASPRFRNALQKRFLGRQVDFLITGGAFISKETLRVLNGVGYRFGNGFGMTETLVTSADFDLNVRSRLKGSIGLPFKGVVYKVEDGELLVKSEYLHHSRLIKGREVAPALDRDGFFHTGDAAREEDGLIYLKGRLDDVVIGKNGENVYLDEVLLYYRELPYIEQTATIRTALLGDEVVGLVLYSGKDLKPQEIAKLKAALAYANRSVPPVFRARAIWLSSLPLPVNVSHKVMRNELGELLDERPDKFRRIDAKIKVDLSGFPPEKVDACLERIIAVYAKTLGIGADKIGGASDFSLDLGGDSYDYIALIDALGEEFESEIPIDRIGILSTPEQFARYFLKEEARKDRSR